MIGVEQIQPLCKVECLNEDCEFHLGTRYFYGCNLKHIMISRTGECLKYKKISFKNIKINSNKRTVTENIVDRIKYFFKKY